MSSDILELYSQNRRLLSYLWRWKVGTTRAIAAVIYPERDLVGAYKALLKQEKKGLIETHSGMLRWGAAWTLTKKGFEWLRELLPEDCTGSGSEYPLHDLIVSAVHQGEFLTNRPESVEFFTEQELRQLDPGLYPEWAPTSDVHRPDGYWRVALGSAMATMALKVEITRKKNSRYLMAAEFYRHAREVKRVLWVTRNPAQARHLHKLITEYLGSSFCNHDFVTYSDFEKFGWCAPIIAGPEKGENIWYLLGKPEEKTAKPVSIPLLLDIRKSHKESKTSEIPRLPLEI